MPPSGLRPIRGPRHSGSAPTTASPRASSASSRRCSACARASAGGIPAAGSGRAAHNYRELDESPRRLNLTHQTGQRVVGVGAVFSGVALRARSTGFAATRAMAGPTPKKWTRCRTWAKRRVSHPLRRFEEGVDLQGAREHYAQHERRRTRRLRYRGSTQAGWSAVRLTMSTQPSLAASDDNPARADPGDGCASAGANARRQQRARRRSRQPASGRDATR
jgi:hypothetical protein